MTATTFLQGKGSIVNLLSVLTECCLFVLRSISDYLSNYIIEILVIKFKQCSISFHTKNPNGRILPCSVERALVAVAVSFEFFDLRIQYLNL